MNPILFMYSVFHSFETALANYLQTKGCVSVFHFIVLVFISSKITICLSLTALINPDTAGTMFSGKKLW